MNLNADFTKRAFVHCGHTRLEGFAYARCGATHARQDR